MQQEACDEVYRDRIMRSAEAYSIHKLGAFGANLGAVSSFFEEPWIRLAPGLSQSGQAWLLNEGAFCLRALGRLTEALEPFRASRETCVEQKDWQEAAKRANNLSDLELALGAVGDAVGDAEQSVEFADRSGQWGMRVIMRTVLGNALHQAGRRADALARFGEAEVMQGERQPQYVLLYSVQGFQYCDLLLADAERGAWKCGTRLSRRAGMPSHAQDARTTLIARCGEVEQRAAQTLKWVTTQNWPGRAD